MKGKRAATEGIVWVIGLIAIFLIIIVSLVFMSISNSGKKEPMKVLDFSETHVLGAQRVGVYAALSDFASNEKGKILQEIYEKADYKEDKMSDGLGSPEISFRFKLVNMPPVVLSPGYSLLLYYAEGRTSLSEGFLLPCNRCVQKYIPFSLVGVRDEK